jgi:hypothetical protein
MHILYKITYLPFLDTNNPKYYIGSKYNYKGNYYGSLASKQIYDYTEGMTLKEWWKTQKNNTEFFLFEIIEEYSNITPQELVNRERDLHLQLNVLGDEYFNHSIATKGFCSQKNSPNTRELKTIKTKEYWNSESGKQKKDRLVSRNRKIMSGIMLEKWKNPSDAMLLRKISGRPKGAKDLNTRKEKPVRKIFAEGIIFHSAEDAAKHFNIHPVNIRRKCRLNYNGTWRYINEDCTNNGHSLGSQK